MGHLGPLVLCTRAMNTLHFMEPNTLRTTQVEVTHPFCLGALPLSLSSHNCIQANARHQLMPASNGVACVLTTGRLIDCLTCHCTVMNLQCSFCYMHTGFRAHTRCAETTHLHLSGTGVLESAIQSSAEQQTSGGVHDPGH